MHGDPIISLISHFSLPRKKTHKNKTRNNTSQASWRVLKVPFQGAKICVFGSFFSLHVNDKKCLKIVDLCKRQGRLWIDEGLLLSSDFDPTDLSLKREKCLQSCRYIFKAWSGYIFLPSALCLNSFYIWDCHLELWCQAPMRNLANDLYAVLYSDSWCAENLFQWLPSLRPKQREALDRPLTLQELTRVILHLSPGPAPTIDAIPAEF